MKSNFSSFHDVFDNLSLTFTNIDWENQQNTESIEFFAFGRYNNLPGFNKTKYQAIFKYRFILKPIESVDIPQSFKCFTYFNEKRFSRRNYKINLEEINILVKFSYHWFPYNKDCGISAAIHSPKIVPPRDTFYRVKQSTIHKFYFSKIEEKRLLNYDKCRVYNISYDDFETRSDCLEKCFINSIDLRCHNSFIIKRPYLLFRNQLSNNRDRNKTNILECQNSIYYTYLSELCGNICQEDCHQAYYLTTIENKPKPFIDPAIHSENQPLLLKIQTNSNPNILIQHFAEITFISLFCNFGGLIGMYLGISLQSVTREAFEITKKLLTKFTLIKISNRRFRNNLNLIQQNIILNNFTG